MDNLNKSRIKEIDSQISELENAINQMRPLLRDKHKEMMRFLDKVSPNYLDLCNSEYVVHYALWRTFWELKDRIDKAEYLILVLKTERAELNGDYQRG